MSSVLLTLAFIITATATTESPNREQNEYINVFPKSARIFISPKNVDYPSVDNSSTYGKFECATRPNVTPLWIINGVSAAVIKTKPGFENTSYSLIPLPANHTLSLLYIPGSLETNNTKIICAAVVGRDLVAFSDPVLFVVLCSDGNACDNTQDITSGTDPASTSPLLPTDKGSSNIHVSPHLIAGVSVTLFLGVVVAVGSSILAAVTCFMRGKCKQRNGVGNRNQAGRDNIYLDTGNRDLLEESITALDTKAAQENNSFKCVPN